MKFQYIEKHRSGFRVEKMAKILKIVRSSYYLRKKRGKSNRQIEDEKLLKKIKKIFKKSRETYGSPRITAELNSRGI